MIQTPNQTLIDLGYESDFATLDMYYLVNKYGSLLLQNCFVNETQVDYELLNIVINGLLIANDYKYKKLKQTIDYAYEYDNNYNRTKQVEIRNQYGQQKTTVDNGESKTTNNYGSQSGNVTNKRNSYDNDIANLAIDNESNTTTNEHIDTTTTNAKTDTETKQSYEDVFTTHETEYGDLSVRTVAEMMKEEREVALFSIYDVIYKDIIKEIALYIFE